MRLSETVRQTVLPSGVTVITDYFDRKADDPHRDMMGAAIIAHTGSLHDPDGKNGLAHLSEHMLSHGIPGVTGKQFLAQAGSLGLFRHNLGTAPQWTRYSANGHSPDVKQYLGIVSEAMKNLAYDNSSLESEKGRIINEMENDLINPREMRNFLKHRAAFLNRPHGKWVGGLPKELEAITLEDIYSHHQKAHAPQNLALITSGGWNHDEACEWADKHLSGLPSGHRNQKLNSKFHYPAHMFYYAPYHTSPHTGPMVGFNLYYPVTNLDIIETSSIGLINRLVSSDRLHSHAEQNKTYSLGVRDAEEGFFDQRTIELTGSAIRASKLRTELVGNVVALKDAIENLTPEAFAHEQEIAVRNSQAGYKKNLPDTFERHISIMGGYLSGQPLDDWERRVESYAHMSLDNARATALRVYGQRPLVLYTAASDDLDFPSSHTLYMAWKGQSGSPHQQQFMAAQTADANSSTTPKASSTGPVAGTAPTP